MKEHLVPIEDGHKYPHCKDCKWNGGESENCQHVKADISKINLITGNLEFKKIKMVDMRAGYWKWACSIEGKLFEAKNIEDLEEKNVNKKPERFKIINKSISMHCCFEYTIVDMGMPDNESPTICECFDLDRAKIICAALNSFVVK